MPRTCRTDKAERPDARAGLTLLALIYVPYSVSTYSEGEYTRAALLKPGIETVIWCLGGFCALVMLVLSGVCWNRGFLGLWALCLAVGLLAFPIAAGYRVVAGLAPWTVCSTLLGPDGETYAFLDSSFMQGQTMALGKVAADGIIYRNFDILGHTNGDCPRSYALIVRPTNKVRTTYGQLHLTSSGTLLGLRYANKCFFAYDFVTNQFAGHGDVESISPFSLVDANSRLHDPDVKPLFKNPDDQPIGLLKKQVLLDAMNHANVEVRRVAKQLLDRHDAG